MNINADDLHELYSFAEVQNHIAKVADEINLRLQGEKILALSLLSGAMVFTGQLLPLLRGEIELDYIHATRYKNALSGSAVELLAKPAISLQGRHILLLDDIYDHGHTLAWVKSYCLTAGAKKVSSAVLALKELPDRPAEYADAIPEFVALKVPNKFIVGMGMDASGLLRNLPGIYFLD